MILMAGHRRRQAASSPAVFGVRTRIAGRIKYAIRPPANRILQDRIGCTAGRDRRTRCVGSRAGSSTKPRRIPKGRQFASRKRALCLTHCAGG